MSDTRAEALARAKQEKAQKDREEFENEARNARHKFGPATAAVRLLAGAYAWREVSDEEYAAALARLAQTSGVELDIPAHRAKLSRHRPNLGVPSDRLRNKAYRGGVLVVSEAGECGWAEFFEAVFGRRVAVVDRATAEHICRAPDDLAIVFHDLSSGKDPDSRVGIVEQLKRDHIDLPVVVFSDRDDVREMRRCLRAGAAGYFCYEPGSGLDRESVATFEQFAGMVRDAIPPESESWRPIWRELRAFTGPTPYSDGANLYRKAVGHLRRAYWFLTTDTVDPRNQLLGENGLTKHVAIACGAAVETVLRNAYREHHHREGASKQTLQNLKYKVRNMLAALSEAGELTQQEAADFHAIWEARNEATHEDGITTRTEAEATLLKTIAVLREFFRRFDPPPAGE